ncbi:type II toxin-antitoxin system HicB family antitoxin [Mesorhizobium sp. M7A.F.Ca.ET.027.03.2.1]|nr:type II toxin-antitoxin system HicB family antitoxin [Mesorhizobium sp. M7A.F.Ca.ET.027.03.2.1]
MRYAVVIEKAGDNFSAYVPDLPGCIATGATVSEVETEIRGAIRLHIEGLRADGLDDLFASGHAFGLPRSKPLSMPSQMVVHEAGDEKIRVIVSILHPQL